MCLCNANGCVLSSDSRNTITKANGERSYNDHFIKIFYLKLMGILVFIGGLSQLDGITLREVMERFDKFCLSEIAVYNRLCQAIEEFTKHYNGSKEIVVCFAATTIDSGPLSYSFQWQNGHFSSLQKNESIWFYHAGINPLALLYNKECEDGIIRTNVNLDAFSMDDMIQFSKHIISTAIYAHKYHLDALNTVAGDIQIMACDRYGNTQSLLFGTK